MPFEKKILATFVQSAKYESKIKEIESKIKFQLKISNFDAVPIGLDVATILSSPQHIPAALGINVLYKIYEGLIKPRGEAKQNPCFFLHKIARKRK